MFYKMRYDMESIDELLEKGQSYIYAEEDNLDRIVYDGIKTGYFNTVILNNKPIEKWPDVEFYYSSIASDRESDYLLNASRWPLVHLNVKNVLENNRISGISFYSVKLVDLATGKVNSDYYLLFVNNFIDGFDMQKSKYKYNEKYNMYTFIPNKTYLNMEKCREFDIFRCNQSPAVIYVSQRIVDLINENKLSGFAFTPQA